jgi:hypothetical protein
MVLFPSSKLFQQGIQNPSVVPGNWPSEQGVFGQPVSDSQAKRVQYPFSEGSELFVEHYALTRVDSQASADFAQFVGL